MGDRDEICQQLGRNAGRPFWRPALLFGGDFQWDDRCLHGKPKPYNHRAIPRYLDYFDLNSPKAKGFALVQTDIEAKSWESYYHRTDRRAKANSNRSLLDLPYLHSRTPPVIHRDIKPSNILLQVHK